eukprot:10734833-Alexandrium_andersonii.AAC.1
MAERPPCHRLPHRKQSPPSMHQCEPFIRLLHAHRCGQDVRGPVEGGRDVLHQRYTDMACYIKSKMHSEQQTRIPEMNLQDM